MYDQSFIKKTLEKEFKNSDYYRIPDLDVEKDDIVTEAHDKYLYIINGGEFSLDLSSTDNVSNSKSVYNVKKVSDKLILRKIAHNIKVINRVKQADRHSLSKNLILLLQEGVQYRIYRKDIKDFYGSIYLPDLVESLEKNWNISRPTIKLIKKLFEHKSHKESGLPRGFHTSVILAEYVMLDFDRKFKEHSNVFFYARFVDDIFIITSGEENPDIFNNELHSSLPSGLTFNISKYKNQIEKIPKLIGIKAKGSQKVTKTEEGITSNISYLGYSLGIATKSSSNKNAKNNRKVYVDLSDSKVKKIKTKIISACLAFIKNSDFDLFYDRLKVLTGNFYIFDKDKNSKQMAGIYFSYKHITVLPTHIDSNIKAIDDFLVNTIISGKGRVSQELQIKLSKEQRKRILKQTFSNGFSQKIIHNFDIDRMIEITRCWRNV